jgi:hypothetical protein
MEENRDMVYSACIEWFQDWLDADPPTLVDEWDASEWMTHEMESATRMFIHHAFHSPHARNDAINILRALYYEYYLFQQAAARAALKPDPGAPTRLLAAPQTPQKSAAWYAESYNMISGHEFGSIVTGSPAERAATIAKKCTPPEIAEGQPDQNIVFLTPPEGLSPFKWGWRFEPVARDLFEMQFSQGTVYDGLGRVKHSTLPNLGASPDGLIATGPRVGRLVELKCPISRQLNGSIPVQYWVQMQLQAEVCDVEAVEYFEVQLGSFLQTEQTHAGFEAAIASAKLPWIGKVCVIADHEDDASNTYRYEYSPLFTTSPTGIIECLAWKPSAHGVVLESALWMVKDYYTTTVLRNRRWWATVGQPAYEEFWRAVREARADGRYARESVPLFVSDSESEENDHIVPENESDADERATSEAQSPASSAVEGWQGTESGQESDGLEEGAQPRIDSDLEC